MNSFFGDSTISPLNMDPTCDGSMILLDAAPGAARPTKMDEVLMHNTRYSAAQVTWTSLHPGGGFQSSCSSCSLLAAPTCLSYEPLHRRWLGDAPHLHPGSLLLLPAGAVGAVCGAAVYRDHQDDGGQDEDQQHDDGHQTDGQQQV